MPRKSVFESTESQKTIQPTRVQEERFAPKLAARSYAAVACGRRFQIQAKKVSWKNIGKLTSAGQRRVG